MPRERKSKMIKKNKGFQLGTTIVWTPQYNNKFYKHLDEFSKEVAYLLQNLESYISDEQKKEENYDKSPASNMNKHILSYLEKHPNILNVFDNEFTISDDKILTSSKEYFNHGEISIPYFTGKIYFSSKFIFVQDKKDYTNTKYYMFEKSML